MISTRGRYALRVMIDLAINESEQFISLKDCKEIVESHLLKDIIVERLELKETSLKDYKIG